MAVFKAYDIRGRYPTEIDDRLAERVGYWTVKLLSAKTIAVGRDVRLAAPAVSAATIRGAAAAGARVTDLGQVTTPMSYFAVGSLKLDGGIMVTASHNPPPDIGFKICRAGAAPVGEQTGLKELEALCRQDPGPASGAPVVATADIRQAYREHLRRAIGKIRPLKIVVDTANGAVGPHFDALFDGLPLQVERLYFEADGRFPNHEPNPLKDENIRDCSRRVVETKADLGVCFDGDGDRCMFLDADGRRIGSDLVTVLLAKRELQRHPGAAIVYDLRSSRVVREEILKAGGVPHRERVGHAFIKQTMRKHDAVLGGELSGHYYFREHYFADSGLLAFAKLVDLLGTQDRPIGELLAPYRRYHATGELNFHVEDKAGAMEGVVKALAGGKSDRLDGVTVEFADWWLNLRPSNTEPLLRLNLEAASAPLLDERRREVVGLLSAFGAVAE